jgi:hypothetical protein
MMMPRSLQEILDNADQLARRFEQFEPEADQVRDAAPLRRIHVAVAARSDAERELASAVAEARESGLSWAVIGAYLGTSGEAARQRYGQGLGSGDVPAVEATMKRSAKNQVLGGVQALLPMTRSAPAVAAAKKAPAKKSVAKKSVGAKKAPARTAAPAAAKRMPAKKAVAKKAAENQAPMKRAVPMPTAAKARKRD